MSNSKANTFDEKIIYIEERSVDLQDPFNLLTPQHSFILLTTETGKTIKCEFSHTGLSNVDFEYQDWYPTICFRKFSPKKSLSVRRALSKFFTISNLKDFNESDFNCQQVCRQFLQKTCNCGKVMLRNDYLRMISKSALDSRFLRLFYQDPFHFRIKSDFPKTNSLIQSQESYEKTIPEVKLLKPLSKKSHFETLFTKSIEFKLKPNLPSFYQILNTIKPLDPKPRD